MNEIVRKEEGASAVEYGLLIAGIAALIAIVVFTLGTAVKGKVTGVTTCINTGATASTC